MRFEEETARKERRIKLEATTGARALPSFESEVLSERSSLYSFEYTILGDAEKKATNARRVTLSWYVREQKATTLPGILPGKATAKNDISRAIKQLRIMLSIKFHRFNNCINFYGLGLEYKATTYTDFLSSDFENRVGL